jgi:hypothetical protein
MQQFVCMIVNDDGFLVWPTSVLAYNILPPVLDN